MHGLFRKTGNHEMWSVPYVSACQVGQESLHAASSSKQRWSVP